MTWSLGACAGPGAAAEAGSPGGAGGEAPVWVSAQPSVCSRLGGLEGLGRLVQPRGPPLQRPASAGGRGARSRPAQAPVPRAGVQGSELLRSPGAGGPHAAGCHCRARCRASGLAVPARPRTPGPVPEELAWSRVPGGASQCEDGLAAGRAPAGGGPSAADVGGQSPLSSPLTPQRAKSRPKPGAAGASLRPTQSSRC